MKSVLLDTHTLLWALGNPQALGTKARKLIENESIMLLVSIASFWEIAIKLSLKKLSIKSDFSTLAKESVGELGVKLIPIELGQLEELIQLPYYHRDPFDRILIVTAKAIKCPLLTKDKHFDRYEIEKIW